MSLQVVVLIVIVEFLGGLSSIPEEQLLNISSTDVKAKERGQNLSPADGSKKIFGNLACGSKPPKYIDTLGSIVLAYGMERMVGEDVIEWASAKLKPLGSRTEDSIPSDIEVETDLIHFSTRQTVITSSGQTRSIKRIAWPVAVVVFVLISTFQTKYYASYAGKKQI